MRVLQTHASDIFGSSFSIDVFCTVHTYDMNNAQSGAISAKSENSILTGLGGTILDLAPQISSNFTILRLRKLVLKTILRLYDSSDFSESTILQL